MARRLTTILSVHQEIAGSIPVVTFLELQGVHRRKADHGERRQPLSGEMKDNEDSIIDNEDPLGQNYVSLSRLAHSPRATYSKTYRCHDHRSVNRFVGRRQVRISSGQICSEHLHRW